MCKQNCLTCKHRPQWSGPSYELGDETPLLSGACSVREGRSPYSSEAVPGSATAIWWNAKTNDVWEDGVVSLDNCLNWEEGKPTPIDRANGYVGVVGFEAGNFIRFGRGPMDAIGFVTAIEKGAVVAMMHERGTQSISEFRITYLEGITRIDKDEYIKLATAECCLHDHDSALRQRNELADALGRILIACEVIRPVAQIDGPTLLMCGIDFAEHLEGGGQVPAKSS